MRSNIHIMFLTVSFSNKWTFRTQNYITWYCCSKRGFGIAHWLVVLPEGIIAPRSRTDIRCARRRSLRSNYKCFRWLHDSWFISSRFRCLTWYLISLSGTFSKSKCVSEFWLMDFDRIFNYGRLLVVIKIPRMWNRSGSEGRCYYQATMRLASSAVRSFILILIIEPWTRAFGCFVIDFSSRLTLKYTCSSFMWWLWSRCEIVGSRANI